MSRREAIFIFCYDVERDTARRRVSAVLEDAAVRVQKSVFEGVMSETTARRLSRSAVSHLAPGDSLRVYAITADGRRKSFAFGFLPMPEDDGLYIL